MCGMIFFLSLIHPVKLCKTLLFVPSSGFFLPSAPWGAGAVCLQKVTNFTIAKPHNHISVSIMVLF